MTQSTKAAIGLPVLTSMVIGNMIGAGIFMLPASLAAYGTVSIIAWCLTGVGALFLALTFASLNKKIPRTGGPYAYCKEGYGDFIGFLVAYTYWISLWVSSAGIVVSSIGYLGVIFGEGTQTTQHPMLAFGIELAAVWLFTVINILGIRTAGFVQLLLTILKIAPLLVISIVALTHLHPQYLHQFNLSDQSNFSAMTSAATLTLWAFLGLETATIPAEHTAGSKDVFKATVYGTLIAAIFYIVCTVALMGLIEPMQLKNSTSPFADAASLLFGNNMGFFIAICVMIAGFGTLNVNTLLQGHIPYAAAKDKLFPKRFANVSRFGTPATSLIISAVLMSILLIFTINSTLMKQFNLLALLATLATLATYFICTMAELMLLIRHSAQFNRHRLIKSSIIALLAGAYSFWMMIGAGEKVVFYGALLIFTSFPAYAWLVSKRKRVPVCEPI